MELQHTIKALVSDPEKSSWVAAFNRRFGEMERALWCLSKNCRAPLIQGRTSPVVEALVWTVKSWWGIQGTRSETKALMAQALATLVWSADVFEQTPGIRDRADIYACDRVSTLVSRCMQLGVVRREWSLASKVLHWLLPWHIPVYDSFVRQRLGIPSSWDHPEAYREITRELFGAVRELQGRDSSWLGAIEPWSPLRGFDKCLWWLGGGNAGKATVVRDPWSVVRQLGLRPG